MTAHPPTRQEWIDHRCSSRVVENDEDPLLSQDCPVAGSRLLELGRNLCVRNTETAEQDAQCLERGHRFLGSVAPQIQIKLTVRKLASYPVRDLDSQRGLADTSHARDGRNHHDR
jgi:hypothetical protein